MPNKKRQKWALVARSSGSGVLPEEGGRELPQRTPDLAALAAEVLRSQQLLPFFLNSFPGRGLPWQHTSNTCWRNQVLEKNDLLASFQQALLRDEGKWLAQVGNPILVGLPAERRGPATRGGHFLSLSADNASLSVIMSP